MERVYSYNPGTRTGRPLHGLTMHVLRMAVGGSCRVRRHRVWDAAAVGYDVRRDDTVWLSRWQPAQVYTVTANDQPSQLTRRRRSCHQHRQPSLKHWSMLWKTKPWSDDLAESVCTIGSISSSKVKCTCSCTVLTLSYSKEHVHLVHPQHIFTCFYYYYLLLFIIIIINH